MIANDIPIAVMTVTIIQGRSIPKMDMLGNTDAYVKVSLDQSVKQTQVCDTETSTPIWNERFMFPIFGDLRKLQHMTLDVWDCDTGSADDLIGSVKVDIPKFFGVAELGDVQNPHIAWVQLAGGSRSGGEVQIMVHYLPKSTAQRVSAKISKSVDAIKKGLQAKVAGYVTSYLSSSVNDYFDPKQH